MRLKSILAAIAVLAFSPQLAYAQTSAFSKKPTKVQANQVLVTLPNKYDGSDILKVEINDLSYLSVHYRNKTTGKEDSVWCAEYTNSGLKKTHNASKPITKPLCDAGIAAFKKATQ
ncbi:MULTISPECIES: hypothetical protein [Vibrio]|uniref:Uncharacterized protein n=1 Tax=Vibrio tasmaniensis TaxID=212663 RepID=A0A2N7ND27_9VIBR|nr:hypothetical protein [Vibrio tasmaniensis]PMO89814.1 hypothetical protein BCT01_00600 [Vibrio tasmaniensis]PMP10013.1 hypothetical protein BCS92_02490 [Vibrio tasmaniensis]TKG32603.1 hypothetical protein FC057_12360 [Vibrio tasmaniensis]TKG41714.1 hypothetical protein FC063_07580 [Vibrio tasmaniensis]TKG52069.1 hypothetical protein FC070_09850 [Vibrio tasmaniensis]